MRRRAEPRVTREREPLAACDAVSASHPHAAAREVEVLAGSAIGMKHDDEVREPAALLACAARIVRILDEDDDAVARSVHRRADRHAEVEREPLRAAMAELRVITLNDRQADLVAVRQTV